MYSLMLASKHMALWYTFTMAMTFHLKSRVAPLKTLTLPRLEHMAAVTASRAAKFVQTSLSPANKLITVHLWTDSQIVLHWLQNGIHSQSFVHQRINEILQHFLIIYSIRGQPN